jgi:hypothetical protein
MFHIKFGQVSTEVIRHLPKAVKGINIVGPKDSKHDNEFQTVCFVCAVVRLQNMRSRKEVRSTLDQLDAEVKRQYSLSILVIHIDDEWKINGKDAIRVEKGDEIQLRRLIGYLVR